MEGNFLAVKRCYFEDFKFQKSCTAKNFELLEASLGWLRLYGKQQKSGFINMVAFTDTLNSVL